MVNCISCNKKVANQKGTTRFNCPECGKQEIVRCGQGRKLATKYKCPDCGFVGPN